MNREQCKKYTLELCGWLGSFSIIAAYACITLDYDKLLLIDGMNLYGSFSVGYICYRKKVWQAMFLEVIWFGIATYSLINNITNDEDQE